MKKYCIVGKLKTECVDEYVEKHKHLHTGEYKPLLEVIKDSGIKEEAVFICGSMVVIYFEADDLDASYQQQAKSEIIQKWNQLMEPMFDSDYEFNKEGSALPVLPKVFDLNEQLNGELKD